MEGGENHLRHAIAEYVAHYHGERTQQGLGNRLIEPANTNVEAPHGPVRRRERLGGMLSFYYRDAAQAATSELACPAASGTFDGDSIRVRQCQLRWAEETPRRPADPHPLFSGGRSRS